MQSELVANEPVPEHDDDPRAAAALRNAAARRGARRTTSCAPGSCTSRARRAARRGRHGPRRRRARGHRHRRRERAGPRARDDLDRRSQRGRAAADREVPRLRLVEPALGARRCATRSTRRSPPRCAPAGTACAASQRAYLDDFWERADVELDGDPALQQAMRFALFQRPAVGGARRGPRDPGEGPDRPRLRRPLVLGHGDLHAAGADVRRAARRPRRAARGATRRSTSRAPARSELSLDGATFPWRTISGQECSGYWPAGTAALHINADIADAARRYLAATEDEAFERDVALELLVETARLWRSVGHHDARGRLPHRRRHRARRVLGARRQQRLHERHGGAQPARGRGDRRAPPASARRSSASTRRRSPRGATRPRAIVIPYDDGAAASRRSPRASRATAAGTSSGTPRERYPLLLHYPYYLLYSSQVVKQADLVFALYVCGDCFSAEQRARDFEYYERITVRDSSLSACIQAIVAAEVGHIDLAYDYLSETAFIDLRDLAFNTRDGVHLAALAGLLARRGRRLRRDARPRRRRSSSRRACRRASTRLALPADVPRAAAARRRSGAPRRATSCSTARALDIRHHGERRARSSGPAAPSRVRSRRRRRARDRRSRRAASRRSATRGDRTSRSVRHHPYLAPCRPSFPERLGAAHAALLHRTAGRDPRDRRVRRP